MAHRMCGSLALSKGDEDSQTCLIAMLQLAQKLGPKPGHRQQR